MQKLLVFSFLVQLCSFLGYGQGKESSKQAAPSPFAQMQANFRTHWQNKPFDLRDFKTVDGRHITEDSLKGKVVFYRFSYHYCSPCRAELPVFTSLSDSFPKVVFVYVTYDDDKTINESFEKTGGTHRVLVTRMSAEAIKKGLYTIGYPTNFFVDRIGVVRYFHSGGRVNYVNETEGEWRNKLEEL